MTMPNTGIRQEINVNPKELTPYTDAQLARLDLPGLPPLPVGIADAGAELVQPAESAAPIQIAPLGRQAQVGLVNARKLLFHLRRRIHWGAGLGRGKGG